MNLMIRSLLVPSHWRRASFAAVAIAATVTLTGCTKQQREGQSAAYLIIDSLQAARGNEPDEESGVLDSDVVTIVGGSPTVFGDLGKIRMRLALKDPGQPANPAVPTSTNYITVTRYHVKYVRTDGRNTQGVDVPYEFDGGATATVTESGADLEITLVRVQSKLEAPLRALGGLGGQVALTTIAEVTFYGKDQAGREVSVKGLITVNFADFAD